MEEIKKLKCELCGTNKYVLISVQISSEAWFGNKGICGECFKGGNFDDLIKGNKQTKLFSY